MTKGTFQVFWTQTAQQDLKRIIEYIATDSGIRAKAVYHALKEKADHLLMIVNDIVKVYHFTPK